MTGKEKIICEAEGRGIEYLVHFTDLSNLKSILSHGLLTRECLNKLKLDYNYNDEERIDGVENSISTSITSPNYKMFYPIRLKDASRDWAVLIINAEKVLKLECAFCKTNAASNSVRFLPIEYRKTHAAFNEMFSEIPSFYSRRQMELAEFEPTDPQAEVLVMENIPVSYIDFIIFGDYYTYSKIKSICDKANIVCGNDSGYFYARHDFSFWQ